MITTINEFINMPENKTKIVLVKYLSGDFEAMGYIPGNSKMVTILRPKHNSVMKDSESYSIDSMKEIRLATEADFDEYRVEMSQFNTDEYIWEKPNNLTENNEVEVLNTANKLLKNAKESPLWNNIITQLNADDIAYENWNDLDIMVYYLQNYNED